ncbi:ABC transporter permease [Desulfacinum infernum]|uniref:ABC transporter permease n=1 Tax=Desulfacinum infernum TaxID=35837 RepID=UPI001C49D646|nr:iron ABC transporter permease [Desulfacinum infernum]
MAWLVAFRDFPGRRIFSWALALPLAMPGYVLAFVMVGLFDFTGPVQTYLRKLMGGDLPWFPSVRSRGGVIFTMTLALYPYVYLMLREAFQSLSGRTQEAAQSLGHSPVSAFLRVVLPMARPWIGASLFLVVMECLADFGTVAVFNYDTFTTAIYKAWYGLFSIEAAAQLALTLLSFVFLCAFLEHRERRRRRYHQSTRSSRAIPPPLGPRTKWLATGYAFLVLFLSVLLPMGQLLAWTLPQLSQIPSRDLLLVGRTFFLGTLAALVVVGVSLMMSFWQRRSPGTATDLGVRIATLGYAFPGSVLAVGVYLPFALLDNLLADLKISSFGDGTFQLKGTLLVMLFGYLVRFLAVGHGAVASGMERCSPQLENAAQSLGESGWGVLRRIHLPLLTPSLLAAGALTMVEVMKEMPLTLMTRPFGWDTLAVRIFELTSEGLWEQAALPALILVLVGSIPMMLASRGVRV